MRMQRISENIKLLDMPELSRDELKAKYGPEGDYNEWRKKQAEDYLKSVKEPESDNDDLDKQESDLRRQREDYLRKKSKDADIADTNRIEKDNMFSNIERTKIDIAAKVSDILGNSLKKGDNTFLDELNSLIDSYSEYVTTIDPDADFVDIDKFRDKETGKVIRFGDLPTSDSDYIVPLEKRKGIKNNLT